MADAVLAWSVGVDPAPLEANLLARIAPLIGTISNEAEGVQQLFTQLRARDKPIETVKELRESITWSELKTTARSIVRITTLKTLARLLEPGGDGFKWPAPAVTTEKRKKGGNGNNKPTITYEQQLAAEGVQPLNSATFRWCASTFDGVCKLGEHTRINECVTVLFDNTWDVMNQVRGVPAKPMPCLEVCGVFVVCVWPVCMVCVCVCVVCVCGVWCVVCGVWCVVCGVWCVVCNVWCEV